VVHRQRAGDHIKRRIRQVQVLRGAHALRYDTEAREKLSDRVSAARPGVTVPAQPKIVADDFVSSGRCPPGTLDQHFFAGQLCKFPDPDDAPKRKAAWERLACARNIRIFCRWAARVGQVPRRGVSRLVRDSLAGVRR
jgi:hypothetical protein